MIYLIGGAPRCGKSILAEQLGHSWISTDTVESMCAACITDPHEREIRFTKSVMRTKTHHSNDDMYNSYITKEIVEAYIAQAATISESLKALVSCSIQEKRDFTIEGYHLQPYLIYELFEQYGNHQIRSLNLVRTDATIALRGSMKNTDEHDWFHNKTSHEKTYQKISDMIAFYGAFIKSESEKYDLPYIEMHGNFVSDLKTAKKIITT